MPRDEIARIIGQVAHDAANGAGCTTVAEWHRMVAAATDSILALAKPGADVPEGWVLVPREPTEAMLKAGYEAQHPKPGTPAYGFETWATWEQACQVAGFAGEKAEIYRAMIAAAPPPPQQKEGER